jgi:hypothetical protein
MGGVGGAAGNIGPGQGVGQLPQSLSQQQLQQQPYFIASPALHEALGLLTNLCPMCPEARGGLSRDSCPTLLQSVLSLLFEVRGTAL